MGIERIKSQIGISIIRAAYKIELWLVKHLLNKSHVFRYVAISHARIIASDIFQDNTMDENIDIAINAIYKLLNTEESESDSLNIEQVEELLPKLKSNIDVMNLLAEYHLAQSYAFSRLSLLDNKTHVEEGLNKAKKFNSEIAPFNPKSFKKRFKEIKAERKLLQKQLNAILENKISKEKEENIEQISFQPTDLAILFSLFSSLFLISGYYYNHSLLKEFNINSDDFFLLSDYISTSISLILTPLLWTGVFLISFLFGADSRFSNRIKEKQLNIKINDKPPFTLPLTIILMNIVNIALMLEGNVEVGNSMLALNGLIVSLYFIEKIPFHYFKNPIKAFGTLLVIIGFTWNLNAKINTEINKITSDDYQPRYFVKFKDKMIKNESLEFLGLNSNYIIMRNTDSNNIEIYPKSYVIKLITNSNQKQDLNFLEWIIKFIEINAKLYEIITTESKNIEPETS